MQAGHVWLDSNCMRHPCLKVRCSESRLQWDSQRGGHLGSCLSAPLRIVMCSVGGENGGMMGSSFEFLICNHWDFGTLGCGFLMIGMEMVWTTLIEVLVEKHWCVGQGS